MSRGTKMMLMITRVMKPPPKDDHVDDDVLGMVLWNVEEDNELDKRMK